MRHSPIKLTVAIFSLLLLFSTVSAQRASIKTADGYLFIQNGKEISFICEVKAKEIKPLTQGENPAFMADGVLIQIVWVDAANYEPTGKVEAAKLLETHRKWETDYLATVFGGTVIPESENLDLNGMRAMFWSFKRPKYTTEFDRDSFLTTLVGRHVLGFNSPVRTGTNLKDAKRRLVEVMGSVRTSQTPYDLLKLAEAIKKGKDPFEN